MEAATARPARVGTTAAHSALRPGPELSVIVPVFNERANVARVVDALDRTLAGIRWEVVFVDDDSPDGTWQEVLDIARCDARVRGVRRVGRRGLSTACIEGMLSSPAPYVAVMDGDLQHDERILPEMLRILTSDEADIVVGSRYTAGGSTGSWDESRRKISRLATGLSKVVLKADLSDPMSGFFMLRREVLQDCVYRLSGIGFKILLDIFASSENALRYREVPYTFREREAGDSKMDNQAAWDYGMLLLDKLLGGTVPVRFITFGIVGGMGVFVHMAVVWGLFKVGSLEFIPSQTIATVVAMTFNFALNNELTYRDRRLRGFAWFKGLASFVVACSIGALSNVGVAAYLFSADSGWVLAAVSGIIVGAVWNYAVTSVYTWRTKTS